MAIVFTMVTMSFQNLMAIRQCAQYEDKHCDKSKKKLGFIGLIILCIWIGAFGIVLSGLNPQADVDDAEENDSKVLSIVSFTVHLSIQMSVAPVLWYTRRITRKLQIDFAARGVHQNLQTRTYIKETIDFTLAMSRVLTLHILTWLVSFTLAFALTHIIDDKCESGNRMAAYTSLVECVTLGFDLGYPFMVSWTQQPLRQRIKKLICFLKRGPIAESSGGSVVIRIASVSGSKTNRVSDVPMSARMHHNAIDEHWRQVAKVRRLSLV